jgi:hypothetical protein
MIQALGLLLAGATAAGLLLADSAPVLLACWVLGAVILSGLAALRRGEEIARAAREGFLVEILGAWALALGGLYLVQASGSVEIVLLPDRTVLAEQGAAALPWAGVAVLVAVACRLGLPPLPPWPAREASAPPAVRIFLHAGLHPLTALVLWQRLDAWLLPWHRDLALWLGGVGSLLLALAAAGERHGARRAALLGASRWAALLAVASHELLPPWAPWLLAGGLATIQLVAATPRWPLWTRRLLLVAGTVAALPAGVPGGPLSLAKPWLDAAPASLLLHAATFLMLRICWVWFEDLRRPVIQAGELRLRRPAMELLRPLARVARGEHRGPRPVAALVGHLARLTADVDRLILSGVIEGLGWIGVGAGWSVAWLDRRGFDAVNHGLAGFCGAAGRAGARAAGARPGRVLGWLMVMVLALSLLGRSLA